MLLAQISSVLFLKLSCEIKAACLDMDIPSLVFQILWTGTDRKSSYILVFDLFCINGFGFIKPFAIQV